MSQCYNKVSSRLHAPKTTKDAIASVLERGGAWFLNSGIQGNTGGLARYYQSDSRSYARVSTEITGYAVSAFIYLFRETGDRAYLLAAEKAAHYLVSDSWCEHSVTFPFEPASNGDPAHAYFFDCGIIVRGLLAIWRVTGDHVYFDRAKECGVSMAFDFMAEEAMHPILRLPEKQPAPYEARWSRRPGCYQLKSALAWRELAIETGQRELASAFERLLAWSLSTHHTFLAGDNGSDTVDRLHAYAYFLEALLFVAEEPACAAALRSGIARLAAVLRRTERRFARSDVYAQLIRVRLFADRTGAVPLDGHAIEHEAAMLREFLVTSEDCRIDGSFWFGVRDGRTLPFANPVSTAFALQALQLWQEHQDGGIATPLLLLI